MLLAIGLAQVVVLFLDRIVLTRLSTPRRRLSVITAKVPVKAGRHRIQCRFFRPSPMLPIVSYALTSHMLIWGGDLIPR